MDRENLQRILEAILFAAGERMEIARLSAVLEVDEKEIMQAADALAEHKACLLSHHGVVATGNDLSAALRMAIEVENLAQCYCIARSLGEVPLLSDEEMALNIEKFKTYGVQK